jgi:hypothetical protein
VCELQLPDGVKGPLFVSIGDAEKLNKFLELNPYIPPENAFVDNYSMDAYKKAGFGSFRDLDPEAAKNIKMQAPDLGGVGGWWKYFTNTMALAPIEKGKKLSGIPEGVLQLGGTFVVKGGDVVYQWSDTVPGDTPDLTEVLRIVQETVSK